MVYQDGVNGCGAAATRNVLAILQRDRHYYSCPLSNSCDTMYKIAKTLPLHGVHASGYLVDADGLLKTKTPFIAQLKIGASYHFVVVTKLKKRRICTLDPALGRRVFSLEVFSKLCTGKVLETRLEKKVRAPRQQFLKMSEKLLLFAISFFELAFLVSCLLLLGDFKFIVPALICFLSTLGTSCGKKFLLYHLLAAVDRRFTVPYYCRSRNRERYLELTKIKMSGLTSLLELTTLVEAYLAFLMLTALKGSTMLVAGLFLSFLAFFLTFVERRSLKRATVETATAERQMESAVDGGADVTEVERCYSTSQKCAERYGRVRLVDELLLIMSSASFALVDAIFTSNLTAVYLIFDFSLFLGVTSLAAKTSTAALNFDLYHAALNALHLAEPLPTLDKSGVLGYN